MRSFREQLTASLLAQLEKRTAPWLRSWPAAGLGYLPRNPVSGGLYQAGNMLALLAAAEERGFKDRRWLTFPQAEELGARVRPHERGVVLQYWRTAADVPARDGGRPARVLLERPRLFAITVYNAEQVDGMDQDARPGQLTAHERHQGAIALLRTSGVIIDAAPRWVAPEYDVRTDTLRLPDGSQGSEGDPVQRADHFYGAAIRELARRSAHQVAGKQPVGSEEHARTELGACVASLVLGDVLGLGYVPGRTEPLVSSWQRTLERDPGAMFRVATATLDIVAAVRALGADRAATLQAAGGADLRLPTLAQGGEPMANDNREYLVVPFGEKDEAKALGARWDKQARSWYAPEGADLEALRRWRIEREAFRRPMQGDPVAEFAEALAAAGLKLTAPPSMDGQLHRVPVVDDKPGERSGAYVGHVDGHPAGFIQNFKSGYKTNWKSAASAAALTSVDRARLSAEAAQHRRERDQAREASQRSAAEKAFKDWLQSKPAPLDHPYLVRKGIEPSGVRVDEDGNLLVPVSDSGGKLWSLQTITADGRKSFAPGSRVAGNHLFLPQRTPAPESRNVFFVAEGYATGASIHVATQDFAATVVAFTAGNLKAVAEEFARRGIVVIAGDNDGTGAAAARAAAPGPEYVVFPRVPEGTSGKDWNDLARAAGTGALRDQLVAAAHRATAAASLVRAGAEHRHTREALNVSKRERSGQIERRSR